MSNYKPIIKKWNTEKDVIAPALTVDIDRAYLINTNVGQYRMEIKREKVIERINDKVEMSYTEEVHNLILRIGEEAFHIMENITVWPTKYYESFMVFQANETGYIYLIDSKDGTYYLVIHSGSRNLGKQVAEIYQQLAVDLHMGKEDYFKQRDEIIRTYKEKGRRAEIQNALKELQKKYETQALVIPEDLCWLYGTFLEDYLQDVEICQAFACRSRERMAEIILDRTGMTALEAFHTIHNYIDTKEMILRKGAIAAHVGEKVLIPINMRDGSVIALGKGNSEWNYSAPHGAGRVMSRSKAKEAINLEEYKEAMKGIYTTSVNESTLDEAPMAYKSLENIVDIIRDSVEIIDIMKPVYNFKASDDEVPWKKRKEVKNGESN